MILTFFKKLLSSGVDKAPDRLIKQRVILTNSLTIAILCFTVALLIVAIFYGLYNQIFVAIFTIALLLTVFRLNNREHYTAASLVLVNFTCIGILVVSFIAYNSSIFAETENWLFGFIALSVFLFDGRRMTIQFALIFVELMIAKYCKYTLMDFPMGRDFTLLVINSIVLCSGLYICLIIVKNGLRKTMNRLNESNETKNKLLSIIAHDIKSPLSTFEALLAVGKQGIISQEEFMNHQRMLNERFEPLQETIDGVLDWAKVQSEHLTPNPREFDANMCVEKIIATYKVLIESKKIKVSMNGTSTLMKMDEDHFKLIMRNLVHNAIKFTQENGTIDIDVRSTSSGCEVCVRDTGIGMSQETITNILTKKVSQSVSGTNGEVGSGLGLNMSLDLLESNECEMEIESKIGEGSLFLLKIPVLRKTKK